MRTCLARILLTGFVLSACPAMARSQSPELVIESGHKKGSVTVYGFSPDNSVMLTGGGYDGTLKLWSVATGQVLRTLTNPASPLGKGVAVATFSPKGTLIASRVENIVSVWNAADGELRFTINTGSSPTAPDNFAEPTIAISSDDRLVAIGTGNSIIVSDLKANRYLGSMNAQQSRIASAAFLSDSWTLVTIDITGEVAMRKIDPVAPSVDTVSAQKIEKRPGGADALDVLHGRLATEVADTKVTNDVSIVDIRTGGSIKRVSSGLTSIYELTLSTDGRFLAAAGSYAPSGGPGDSYLTVTDLATGGVVWARSCGTPGAVFSRPAFSNDGSTVTAAVSTSVIETYDSKSGRHARSYAAGGGEVAAVDFSPTAPTLAIGTADGAIALIDLNGDAPPQLLGGHPRPTEPYSPTGGSDLDPEIYALQFSPDGKTLASAGLSSFRIWNAASGDLIRILREPANAGSLAWAPDGRTIGLAGEEFTFHTWDLAGNPVVTFNLRNSFIYSFVFSPDGKSAAVGSFYKAQIFDAITGSETATPIKETQKIQQALAFSTDGAQLAIGNSDGDIRIWDMAGGQILKTLSGHKNGVNGLKFLRNGKLVSASSDGTLKLWDVGAGTVIRSFSGHTSDVLTVAVSPDGRLIASGSRDGTTKLWNTNTGELIATITILGKTDWVVTRPDGRFDTNKPLDRIEGLHWLLPHEGLRPFALDLFTREYYEPGLLRRSLRCDRDNICSKEFKPVASIAAINRVRSGINLKPQKR